MAFDFKKFIASGTKPVEQRGKGARPKGSPKATVFPGPNDKKKKVVKKKVTKTNTRDSKKLINKESIESGIGKKTQRKVVLKQNPFKNPALTKTKTSQNKTAKDFTLKELTKKAKIFDVKKGRETAEKAGLKPGAGVFYDKGRNKLLASVTAKQLADSGLTLNQYLNKARGLTPRNKTTKTNLAMKSRSMTDSYKPDDTVGMKGYKTGGITKRRFGGMAKGGFKMPNKVKIT